MLFGAGHGHFRRIFHRENLSVRSEPRDNWRARSAKIASVLQYRDKRGQEQPPWRGLTAESLPRSGSFEPLESSCDASRFPAVPYGQG